VRRDKFVATFARNSHASFPLEVDFQGWNAAMDRGMPMADAVQQLKTQFPHRADWIDAWMNRWRESLAGPIPRKQPVSLSASSMSSV